MDDVKKNKNISIIKLPFNVYFNLKKYYLI
jgi:hypothetical protein